MDEQALRGDPLNLSWPLYKPEPKSRAYYIAAFSMEGQFMWRKRTGWLKYHERMRRLQARFKPRRMNGRLLPLDRNKLSYPPFGCR